MPEIVEREQVRRLMAEEEAVLVDVLPRAEYEAEHLQGAVNIPLKELNAATTAHLDRSRPVITYCHDSL